jgi:phenylpropionate dioxygenase-like ring-hydroxylating dioxygenase large terminal subunit
MKVQEKRANMGNYAQAGLRRDGTKAGWSLGRDYYKDPTIFEREKEKIIYDSWIFAGHVSQIPNKGDYFLYRLLDESAIIVRTSDSSIQAYYNVCRHRGSQICKEDKGTLQRFTCPYHAWTYKLDGSLMSARGMPEDFDRGESSLHVCAMEIIGGMIFVNFSDTPDSLDKAREDLAEPLAMYDFEHMKVAVHKNYQINANWKVTLENYQECYHCSPSHPEYALMHTLTVDEDRFDKLQGPMMSRMEVCGIKHMEIDKQFNKKVKGQEQYAYSRYALFEKYKTGSKSGEPVAPLLGDLKGFDNGASDINIGPLTYYLIYNDHAVVYVFTPTAHETSQCDLYWLVRGDAEEGTDYSIKDLTWLWHTTILADERIIIDNQKGINSRKYKPGPLAKMEYLIDKYVSWYLDEMEI